MLSSAFRFRRLPARAGALLSCSLLLAGCGIFAPTISVREAGPDRVYESLNENALNSDGVSTKSRETLHGYGLTEVWEDNPRAALAALHAQTILDPTRANLFAMSECAYRIGRDDGDRNAHLTAAIFAWHYLLGHDDDESINAYDRRFRWACDVYNDAVLRAFVSSDGTQMVLRDSTRTLPFGTARITVDTTSLPWSADAETSFLPADQFLIKGLSLRLRDSGLGVPLIAVQGKLPQGDRKTSTTAFLRVSGGLPDVGTSVDATLELHSVFTAPSVVVGDENVPLESDLSTMLAYTLHESDIWDFSLKGLFEGGDARKSNLLRCIPPLSAQRIPVVFVHGTASNPAYWAEMFNTLQGDPELRERMQFWFFQYDSGNPLLYTAATLRDALRAKLAELDPEGNDPALQQMVIIGHSQGGLVAKLMVVDGSLRWLEETIGAPVEPLELEPDALKLLTWAYEFDPVPQVRRVVFISTPQHGSFVADSWFARMIAKFIAVPGELKSIVTTFGSSEKLPPELRGRVPTSLDNMNPSNPLLKILSMTPIAAGVTAYSIIAVGDCDTGNPETLGAADDGVVEYKSAHIEGVESEFLVNAQHSCQDNPVVILEVRRILREHLGLK